MRILVMKKKLDIRRRLWPPLRPWRYTRGNCLSGSALGPIHHHPKESLGFHASIWRPRWYWRWRSIDTFFVLLFIDFLEYLWSQNYLNLISQRNFITMFVLKLEKIFSVNNTMLSLCLLFRITGLLDRDKAYLNKLWDRKNRFPRFSQFNICDIFFYKPQKKV